MESAVALDKVCFSYQDALVLKDVSFKAAPGEFIGMIGPNGGGKTTLLKLIMGFIKPLSGSIQIFNEPPASALKQISYVPQSLRFDKQFPISVLELVMGGRLAHLPWYGRFSKADKEAAMESLECVGMADFRNRSFGNLSGGQAQRALIARALASEPHLLLLDEPTASVDAQAESDIYSILKKLQGKITIIMVTHNLRAAIELVERVICVQQTAVVLNPQEVCEHFAFGLYHAPLIKLQNNHKAAGNLV